MANKTVNFRKAENGFIIRVSEEVQNKKGFIDYKEKEYVAEKALKAQEIIKRETGKVK